MRRAILTSTRGLLSSDRGREHRSTDETLANRQIAKMCTWARVDWDGAEGKQSLVIDHRVLVGSSQNNGIVLDDRTVSRVHAELEPREDGIWVRDLGSRNGTTVEGIQVQCARIPNGGRVRIGSSELVAIYESANGVVDMWPRAMFGPLLGASDSMREMFATLARIAPTDAPVLIRGETGTGKELVARAIHEESPRAAQPFVVVDCAAIPENLLDSELFGHAKGAFTGAANMRLGAFEAANGGTVFLDEIGELPLAMQPRLLRVLESSTVRRVGETERRRIDVRFLSATHRDLPAMVTAGLFREDLFFRLAVLPVHVPPLRERAEDIDMLVRHFLPPGAAIGPDFVRDIASRPWRGNVRELRNFVARAVALGPTEALAMTEAGAFTSIPPAAPSSPSLAPTPFAPAVDVPVPLEGAFKSFRERWIEQGERSYVRALLERHGRNVAAAARDAGVDRTYLYRLIRKYDI